MIVRVFSEQRKQPARSAPGDNLGATTRDQIERGESLKDAHRIGQFDLLEQIFAAADRIRRVFHKPSNSKFKHGFRAGFICSSWRIDAEGSALCLR